MNIIDEIRGEADWHDSLASCGHGYDIRSIADRLASMNALVPVPDGEPCIVYKLHISDICTCGHDGVWQVFGYRYCGPDRSVILRNLATRTETELLAAAMVQPVRLVPLGEVEHG